MIRLSSYLDIILPLDRLLVTIQADKGTGSMLLSCLPSANEFATICVLKGPFSILEVINEQARINASIWPFKFTYTIHLVLSPLAFVLCTV